MIATLVTIPISHYGDRARWALDLAGVPYREVHHLQMFSWVAALRLGGQKTLPVVQIDGRVLTDSGHVLRHVADHHGVPLFPIASSAGSPASSSDVESLSDTLAGAYGIATRLIGYDWFFRAMDVCLPVNAGRASELEVRTLTSVAGLAKPLLSHYLGVRPAEVAAAIALVDRTMDEIAERLADGRRYLFGDTFSAADLTFATMTAPSVLPREYPVVLPDADEIPPDARARVLRYREHPAGAFALRLYGERPIPRGSYDRGLRVNRRSGTLPR